MKQFILILLIFTVIVLLTLVAPKTAAHTPVDPEFCDAPPKPVSVPEQTELKPLEQYVKDRADHYSVSAYRINRTIECESNWKNTHSKLTYPFSDPSVGIVAGTSERSYGIAQINLDYNPQITKEQAMDKRWSIDFMAKKFAQGKHGMWYAYDWSTDTCTYD